MTQVSLFYTDQYGISQPVPYPWAPAARPTDTSVAAAEAMAPRVETLKAQVLEVLRAHPEGMTADEIAAAMGESILTIRPRVAELRRLGHVEPTEWRRANASGRTAIVWRIG